MATDLSSIRTMQDVINVLSIIFFNMNEIERIYYDMFINPEAMDVTFQRYDDQGVLSTITLPNRASLSTENILTGEGSPNNVVAASPGTFYLDTVDAELYYKNSGTNTVGWSKFYTNTNFQAGVNYLTIDGDGSQIKNLNMSNAGSGFLPVVRGGTGTSSIMGLVKGNGTSAFSAAVDGVDYLGPNSMPGLIAYYPVNNIPTGWLRCDGSEYSRTTYARLFGKIGTTYGEGDGTTTFNVPDLYNYFIRCWDGNTEVPFNTVQNDQIGRHNHTYSGDTGEESASHTHKRGTMEIEGKLVTINYSGSDYEPEGAFYDIQTLGGGYTTSGSRRLTGFKASKSWEGDTTIESVSHTHPFAGTTSDNTIDPTSSNPEETRVLNKMLIPVIKF